MKPKQSTVIEEPEVERNPLCGHDIRFRIDTPEGERGCVLCVASEAIQIGRMQADEYDTFWAALGVLSKEVTVEQAISKWKAMEGVLKAAKAIVGGMYDMLDARGRVYVGRAEYRKLEEAIAVYDEQPNIVELVEAEEEPA